MKTIKNILKVGLIGLTLCFLPESKSQTALLIFSTNNMAASGTVVIPNATVIDSLMLQTTNGAGGIVRLYDGSVTNVTAAHTNVVAYSTNRVVTYVTTTGVTNTFTNTVWYYDRSLQAALTNNTPPVYSIVVPGNGVVVSADVSLLFGTSVTLSNSSAGLNANIYYRKP